MPYCITTHKAHSNYRILQPASTTPHKVNEAIGMEPGHMTYDACPTSSDITLCQGPRGSHPHSGGHLETTHQLPTHKGTPIYPRLKPCQVERPSCTYSVNSNHTQDPQHQNNTEKSVSIQCIPIGAYPRVEKLWLRAPTDM